ncbi:Sec1-like family protein [Heterostelium album PN500]|uniref:Sec1-like family protein n=1 Tax=Heterostelium pallidum (strain ATCC 26659 / Pp 5 / PN500) TaxID=670386 RepID=D3BLW8_HETP5|nr:Sec1-like family protein [Heterostelium album PN500]EFA77569.1 Sec1-like family protein [Heterostelium album PN500]|eukprot:XP_020429697.1 Sec1-like family protein [Heterostelium album PN500]
MMKKQGAGGQPLPPQQQQQQQRPPQPAPAQAKKPAAIVLSQIPNISSKVLNLTSIREQSKRELGEALDILKGGKALVMDPKVIGLLNLIVDPQFLNSHGAERNYELKTGKLETNSSNIIYIIRPKIKYMHIIKEHIQRHLDEGLKKTYAIVYIPRSTILAQRVLEEEGVAGNIEATYELPLDIVPFDEDVLSLELPSAYKEFLLEGDRTSLFYVAKSLMKLQSMFGTIPLVKGKGQCSRLVMDLITRMRKEMGEESTVPPEIDSLILIDRDVDLITPMCTQLTYEEEINETNPTDMAYVYSGYAPLSCRLVQQAIRPGGWKAIEETLRLLPGPTFEEIQPLPQGATTNVKSDRKPITLVYFIGGVTFAEISALRFLSRQDQANRDFIIITTKLINGDTLVDNLVEKLEDD